MLIIGIDPGLAGAIAFHHTEGGGLTVEDLPTFRVTRGGKDKRDLNAAGLAQMIEFAIQGKQVKAYVEQVGSMPGQGVSSVFAFGKTFGTILGVLAANYIETELVAPATWKRVMGIKSGSGKDVSRQRATQAFPNKAGLFARVKDDGRAEAALIALYGARQIERKECA
jgi:crossover junction endodeoxyribonuclease RuvC